MAKGMERADVVLAEQGLAESREKAKRLIMAGQAACPAVATRCLRPWSVSGWT